MCAFLRIVEECVPKTRSIEVGVDVALAGYIVFLKESDQVIYRCLIDHYE